jgi:hypothetical protein
MLKADQAAIIQQANMAMVSLRTAEIQYFGTFFSSFGTQAAILGGFGINALSQAPCEIMQS